MIYTLLKFLCKITVHSYFRRVQIIGKEKIPVDGPCIYIANHPSAFMDPIVVASTLSEPVYFIAAGEYVGTGAKGWIFKHLLHMIPVFRPSTRPEDVHKNKQMFEHCFSHLSEKRSLLIFPEGVSITERKIKPFKTGIARISRGAELRNNLDLNINVVPIGLNYSDPHQFRSDLFVKIGDPILVKDFISATEKNEIEEVERLTQICEDALQETVIHTNNETDDSLLIKLNTIYSRDLKLELGIEPKEQEREFIMQKEMIEAIEFFKINQLEKFNSVTKEINDYALKLSENGLKDKDIMEIKFQKSFRRITSYILGFPFFVLGFLNNFIPYFFVQYLVAKIKLNENFKGSMILAIGLFSFLGFYFGTSLLLGLLSPLGWWALLYPFVMYISGIYSLIYFSAIYYSGKRKNLRRILKSNKEALEELIVFRKKLISMLDDCRVSFQENKKSQTT